MPLIEKKLFENVDRVATAIRNLQTFEPDEGYYLAFSGGKDSCTIKTLADMAGVKYDAHYSVTGIDPPELVHFIKEHHADVKWERGDIPLLIRLQTRGFPIRQGRWCCQLLKEGGGGGRVVITGIRKKESYARSKRKLVEHCIKGSNKTYLHIIIDWSSEDVWDFLKGNDIPYCSLYDEGFKRLGCIFCPMQTASNKERDRKRWPSFEKAFRHAFRKLYKNRVDKGNDSVSRWKDGDDMFDWWISNVSAPPKDGEGDPGLFD